MFFRAGQSLGKHPIALTNQAQEQPAFSDYIENQRWIHNDVLFVTLHIVGSNNNFEARDPRATQEFFERDAANWQHRTSYTATQAVARSARTAHLGAIRYASVCDPEQRECIALLTPAAFSAVTPHPTKEAWWLQVKATEVVWRSDQRSLVLSALPWQ